MVQPWEEDNGSISNTLSRTFLGFKDSSDMADPVISWDPRSLSGLSQEYMGYYRGEEIKSVFPLSTWPLQVLSSQCCQECN